MTTVLSANLCNKHPLCCFNGLVTCSELPVYRFLYEVEGKDSDEDPLEEMDIADVYILVVLVHLWNKQQ